MRTMNIHLYTEIFNCTKIGKIAIASFLKYHPNLLLHVYGAAEDLLLLKKHPQIVRELIVDRKIIDGFKKGHEGTARLWAYIIQRFPNCYLIHFDTDVVFRANFISELIEKIPEYDLVGPKRHYKNNPQGFTCFDSYDDTMATACFIFNTAKITPEYLKNTEQLSKMCQGTFNPLKHPILDFFDPIVFDMLKNGAKKYYFGFDDVGAIDDNKSRDNCFAHINRETDFGNKMMHFAAVGSGMNFYNHPDVKVPQFYRDYAIKRYALFCKIFYCEDIDIDLSEFPNTLANTDLILESVCEYKSVI